MLSKILCFFGRHSFITTQRFGVYGRRIACLRCGRMWAMHDDAWSLLSWDWEFVEMYESFGYEIKYRWHEIPGQRLIQAAADRRAKRNAKRVG